MIKFRVWDKNIKTYLEKHQTFNFIYLDENYVYTLAPYEESQKIEQFTGLQDKNGKDIYEGDIIRVLLPNNKPKRDFIAYVFWDNTCSGFRLSKYDYFISSNSYGFEIIGNINENKEIKK